jgi:hypothetical protein
MNYVGEHPDGQANKHGRERAERLPLIDPNGGPAMEPCFLMIKSPLAGDCYGTNPGRNVIDWQRPGSGNARVVGGVIFGSSPWPV